MGEIFDYFKTKKNLVSLLVLGILILGIPLGVNLVRLQQIIKSRAAVESITFTGLNVKQKSDGTWVAAKPQIQLQLISPLGPPPGGSPPAPPSSLSPIIPTAEPIPSEPIPTFEPIPDYNNFTVGFNSTGIIHYGYGDLFPYSSSQDIDANLNEISRMEGKVIRVFVANNYISDIEAAQRLDDFLTKAASYDISVIATLINFYGGNGFYPQGVQGYYTDNWNGTPLLGHDFFAGGYREEYMSFLRTVVSYNRDHSNIYAWEPGNELKDSNSPETFVDFMADVTREIKILDPTHAVATGMINAAHTDLAPEELYSALPDVDIITIHNYNGSKDGLSDVDWAVSNGKTVINEEMGFAGSGDRSSAIQQELDFWAGQGVKAVLQWGFLAQGLGDNGDGDRTYGMDTIWHMDYDQLVNLFTAYNI